MQLIYRLISPASAGRFAHAMCRKAETCGHGYKQLAQCAAATITHKNALEP